MTTTQCHKKRITKSFRISIYIDSIFTWSIAVCFLFMADYCAYVNLLFLFLLHYLLLPVVIIFYYIQSTSILSTLSLSLGTSSTSSFWYIFRSFCLFPCIWSSVNLFQFILWSSKQNKKTKRSKFTSNRIIKKKTEWRKKKKKKAWTKKKMHTRNACVIKWTYTNECLVV